MASNIKSPCTADCPNRSTYCRKTCGKHKIYEALRNKNYEEQQKLREQRSLEYSYHQAVKKRCYS